MMVTPANSKGDSSYFDPTIHYSLNFKKLCLITAAFPFCALVICFITANIFQPDEVHETHCRVYNIIPSISAITGVSPQRYLWRITVALHIGPRYIIAAVYRAYQHNLIGRNADIQLQLGAKWWLDVAFWFNILEISALAGVTYISNVENYPVHEKLFIVFMLSSIGHMIAAIKALKKIALSRRELPIFNKEIFYKQCLLVISIVSSIGMVGFFVEHRLLCHDMAFSWFALCEYVIATANMAFHCTLIFNFPTEHMIVARGLHKPPPGIGWKLD